MERKLLYHITSYKNLPSILKSGQILAHSLVKDGEFSHSDIAHKRIQDRRSTTSVNASPFGRLHDYVPFYFAPRSPMLYAIKNNRVEGFEGEQSDIIYFVTDTEKIIQANKKFVFTNGHPIMALTDFYNDLNDLDKIDWDVMQNTYWHDTDEFPDRKWRRQAEFLVHQTVELESFLGIGVFNSDMKNRVNNILREHKEDMTVLIKPEFYF
ncbi:hypothetical protein ABID56_001514 [Alkalibacillus flavidus]|uniref:DarT domain-containing protein n=1 Tax=Alkalibacillus flavidus TaxID=546021 RepID=A0ABV2KV18_9BACI